MKVKRGVFPPLSNNCYLIVDEATNYSALVDCSVWNDDMKSLIGDTQLKYILLTHGHYDHTGGVKEVQSRYGAKVHSLAAISRVPFEKTNADLTVGDGDIITLGETKIKVISTPGHTVGGVCFLAENALFTGDTLFKLSCGRTDFPGGSWEELENSLKKLRELDGDFKVYTGHDDTSTLDFERKNNMYMRNL